MNKIKLLVVDDQSIVRDGIKMILSLSNEIEVLGTSENGQSAINFLHNNQVDIVLMDVRMPILNGVEATKLIKDKWPNIKIIILTTFNDDELIFEALKNGASSYMLKDISSEELINSIKLIFAGQTVFRNDITQKLLIKSNNSNLIDTLTSREIEISNLIAEGMSNKEISKKLFLAEGTVKNHLTSILSKLKLNHRTQLAIFIKDNYKKRL